MGGGRRAMDGERRAMDGGVGGSAEARCQGFLCMFIYKTKNILYLVEFFWRRKYWYDIYFSLYKKFVKNSG